MISAIILQMNLQNAKRSRWTDVTDAASEGAIARWDLSQEKTIESEGRTTLKIEASNLTFSKC
jgi:hypothetical protein